MNYSRRGIEKKRNELHAKMPKFTNALGAGFYKAMIIVFVPRKKITLGRFSDGAEVI